MEKLCDSLHIIDSRWTGIRPISLVWFLHNNPLDKEPLVHSLGSNYIIWHKNKKLKDQFQKIIIIIMPIWKQVMKITQIYEHGNQKDIDFYERGKKWKACMEHNIPSYKNNKKIKQTLMKSKLKTWCITIVLPGNNNNALVWDIRWNIVSLWPFITLLFLVGLEKGKVTFGIHALTKKSISSPRRRNKRHSSEPSLHRFSSVVNPDPNTTPNQMLGRWSCCL